MKFSTTDMPLFSQKKRIRVLWQTYASPASCGFPLSVPSACGLYKFFHLKGLYSFLIPNINFLFFLHSSSYILIILLSVFSGLHRPPQLPRPSQRHTARPCFLCYPLSLRQPLQYFENLSYFHPAPSLPRIPILFWQ